MCVDTNASAQQYLAGRRNRILFGGTRAKIKLSRPWQMDLAGLINPEKCPFCTQTPEKRESERYHIENAASLPGWDRLVNIFTPHPDHRLIIPDACWSSKELQRWGGEERLDQALFLATDELRDQKEKAFLINVGMQAGQNTGHPHMHVFTALPDDPWSACAPFNERLFDRDVFLFEHGGFRVVAAGAHAGECLIFPERIIHIDDCTATLAHILSRLIGLGNEKFRSEQGLAPPWSVIVRVAKDGLFRYASYVPTLHLWGALEHSAALYEGVPFVLPWPHATTAAYLREK